MSSERRFPQTTKLSKSMLGLSILALLLYIVGFMNPHMLHKEFILPGNYSGLPFDLDAEVHMGIQEACFDVKYPDGTKDDDCTSDGGEDWQKISAYLAFAGLTMAGLGLILTALGVLVKRTANNAWVKSGEAICYNVTATLQAVILLLYDINRKIEQRGYPVKFDLSWAYVIFLISNIIYFAMCIINIVELCRLRKSEKEPLLQSENGQNYKSDGMYTDSGIN